MEILGSNKGIRGEEGRKMLKWILQIGLDTYTIRSENLSLTFENK